MKLKLIRLGLLAAALLVVAAAGLLGWNSYRRARARYDDYRARIQPGISVAGIPVGGLTPGEARQKVTAQAAEPYYRAFTLYYEDAAIDLSPAADLGLDVPVQDMVDEAVSASHQEDYWDGFWQWLTGSLAPRVLDISLRMEHDPQAAGRYMAGVARSYDAQPTEPVVDMRDLAFIPGRPGRKLDADTAARLVEERIDDPEQRQVTLPVSAIAPDHSPARIESMLSTLGPVMERAPGPPSFYTATLPVSTTGGIENTPRVTYTGELTWTFPHFAGYDGPLTTTYGYFFDPGEPGLTFDVEAAVRQVRAALASGITAPITFEPDWVPPPSIDPEVLVEPLEARLATFPGVSSLLVKNLDSGQVVYDVNTRYVLSGMSVAKIGIMVEVYRYHSGTVDAQTHQELLDMLGSESCNPCANRLMATVGGGSSQAGAQRVTASMQRLGLANFRLCAPFRVVDGVDGERTIASRPAGTGRRGGTQLAAAAWGTFTAYLETPRYDRCVKATPAEMAHLVEMIYDCTQGKGTLLKTYPAIKPAACQEMIDIMAANDLRNMLGAGIPPDVKLAHKHGFAGYDVPWGDTRAEVGIIFSPGATILVAYYIWDDTPWIDYGVNQPLYRDVSNMIYNFFNPDDPFWPEPQWVPDE